MRFCYIVFTIFFLTLAIRGLYLDFKTEESDSAKEYQKIKSQMASLQEGTGHSRTFNALTNPLLLDEANETVEKLSKENLKLKDKLNLTKTGFHLTLSVLFFILFRNCKIQHENNRQTS